MSINELKIKFGKKVIGSGSDVNGEFTLKGKKLRQNLEIRFKKAYENNESYEIEYRGLIDEALTQINGEWSIKEYGISGEFRLEKVVKVEEPQIE